jgi:hypothetical protein
MSDRLTDLWKLQPLLAPSFTPESLHAKARAFHRRIFWRNSIEYAAGAIVVAGNAFNLWLFADGLTRIGSTLVMLGTLFVLYQLHRRASTRKPSPERLALPAAVYYRDELVRQRDALRSVFFWYLLPLFPGIEIFFLGRQLAVHAAAHVWLYLLYPAVAAAILFLNLHGARKLQEQIDQLDRDTGDTQ